MVQQVQALLLIHQAHQVLQEFQAHQEIQVQVAKQVQEEHQVLQVLQVLQEVQVQVAKQVQEEHQVQEEVLQVLLEQVVHLELAVHQVLQE